MKKRKDKRKKIKKLRKAFLGLTVVKGKGLRSVECFQCHRKLIKKQKRVIVNFMRVGKKPICLHCGRTMLQRKIDTIKFDMKTYKKELKKIRDGDLVMEAI